MTEISKIIAENGIATVLAAVFIWDWIYNRKVNNETLQKLSDSNENIAKALELLKMAMENNDKLLRQHDERSIQIFDKVNGVAGAVSNCRIKN